MCIRDRIGPEVIGERAAERFRMRHPHRPLEVDITRDLPLVSADPVLFRRVVDNLLDIFTPFFRAERSRARGTGGVGLGLTLAKRIVDAHGGTIDVTSASGTG